MKTRRLRTVSWFVSGRHDRRSIGSHRRREELVGRKPVWNHERATSRSNQRFDDDKFEHEVPSTTSSRHDEFEHDEFNYDEFDPRRRPPHRVRRRRRLRRRAAISKFSAG